MTDVEQTPPPPQNGFDIGNDDEAGKTRPADIEQDMREMERRKRVDAIMSSKMFREELERIVDSARDGGTHGILQHLSDIVGIPQSRLGNVFKSNNCVVPINDIRGIESIGYTKGEKILRCKLASTFRLLDLFNWSQGDLGAQITARLKVDQEIFLVNPYGLLYNEITASSLNKVDMQGNVVEHGTTNFLVNKNHFSLHSAVHAARPDIRCAIYIGCSPVVAISSLRTGLLPLTKDACVLGEITTFSYTGSLLDADERDRLVRNLGPISKILLLSNHGALCCGETIEEAFFAACRIIQACETQLQLLPVGLDNLVLIPDETRKVIYDQSRRPPDDLAKKFAASASIAEDETDKEVAVNNKEKIVGAAPKWRVGGAEFEALMRMLDNAGFRTGYIYRHPLIKSELPKPKNDVELPPAVSSLGYLLEEEEYFRQGIWKKGDLRKGGDRSKWLNSPNVYQKVEVLETGTPDPKKITKWVAEGSPTHSTPVRIEDPLQFVPVGTTSKEFKRIQQQIKENRRADKISAGPQSHILEGVTWDEANRSLKDGTVTTAGDHVVLMGAASKGIIQRGFQHNAAVYKAPYAKNPFDHVTDDEINEYTRTVERKKKSIHGEYTDTDFSESEPLSSLQTSGGQKQTTTSTTAAAVSHSEPEDAAHQVLRIQTQQVPVRSQAEVVMSDVTHKNSLNNETTTKRITLIEFERALIAALLERKYAFLYAKMKSSRLKEKQDTHFESPTETEISNGVVFAYIIHKIEIYPRYNYPTVQNNNNNHNNNNNNDAIMDTTKGVPIRTNNSYVVDTESSSSSSPPPLPPYRTVSHYGFNYPLTYLPSISLYPPNLLAFSDDINSVQLQRHLVIEFIKSTALSLKDVVAKDPCISVKEIHLASASSSHETTDEAEEEQMNYITVKQLELMRPSTGRRKRWPRTISSSSSTAHSMAMTASTAPTTSTYPEHEEDDSLSTNFSHCSISSLPPPPPPPPPALPALPEYSPTNTTTNNNTNQITDSKNILRTYIFRKSQADMREDIGIGIAAVEYKQRHRPEADQQRIHANDSIDNNAEINDNRGLIKRRAPSTSSGSTSLTVGADSLQSNEQSQEKAKPLEGTDNDKKFQQIIKDASTTAALTAASVKAHINAEQQTLEIHISICTQHQHQNQLHDDYFKHLSNVIDCEMQMISQQLVMGEEPIENVPKISNNFDDKKPMTSSPPTQPSAVSKFPSASSSPVLSMNTSSGTALRSSNNDVSQTLNLLESELEKLLNGILRINSLTHNLRSTCAAAAAKKN